MHGFFRVLVGGASARAGRFFIALPISTAILLPMAYLESGSFGQIALVARSAAVAVPFTLFFFVPFFFAERLEIGFWIAYPLAFVCLGGGFVVHRTVMSLLGSPPAG